MVETAEDFKTKGNEYFKINCFSKAIDQYTKSIEIGTDKR